MNDMNEETIPNNKVLQAKFDEGGEKIKFFSYEMCGRPNQLCY